MAVSAEQFAAELRAFDGRRSVVQAARRGLTRALPAVRQKVRDHAIEILPSSGGLGAWVAAAKVAVRISYASRSAGVRLKGGRKSRGDKSDLQGIDSGRVRAPSWGHRTAASWHSQSVPAGWWSTPLESDEQFSGEVDRAVDEALEVVRRG